jgi:hypothetical protein
MFGIDRSWAFFAAHPLVGGAAFLLVSLLVIAAFSRGALTASLAGLFRVAWTILSTPFDFMQKAMTVIRTSKDDEAVYADSRVFTLFRLNRIQYLALLVVGILILSSGITSSLFSLYPQQEIAQSQAISQEVKRLEEAVTAAQAVVAQVATPAYTEGLRTAHEQAQSAHQRKAESNAALVQNSKFSGPIITQLANTNSASFVDRVRTQVDSYMSGCPRGYNWTGMTFESCGEFRALLLNLADGKAEEIRLRQAADEAETAWRNAGAASETANAQLASATASLEAMKLAQAEASPMRLTWLWPHVLAAVGGLLATFGSLILTVWLGATAISVLSWLVLMMRGLEKGQTAFVSEGLERSEP